MRPYEHGKELKHVRQQKPSHLAYTIKGEGDKARWLEIGVAWQNEDGRGFNIVLEALPVNGRITLRVKEPKPTAE